MVFFCLLQFKVNKLLLSNRLDSLVKFALIIVIIIDMIFILLEVKEWHIATDFTNSN